MKPLPVVGYADTLPGRLSTALELSAALEERGVGISPERLGELADSYFIPHFRVDGGAPLFSLAEARKWIAHNLTQRINGQELPAEHRVLVQSLPADEPTPLPMTLSQMADKLIRQGEIISVSGVYFLCRGERVIYVGQAVCSGARIAEHRRSGRTFDRAYILPVAPSQLDAVEGAFIRALRPEENIMVPRSAQSDGDVLASVGVPELRNNSVIGT